MNLSPRTLNDIDVARELRELLQDRPIRDGSLVIEITETAAITDGEFVRQLPSNAADQLVVRAVVDIAGGLGAGTIAEFVEDEHTLKLLREFGVGYSQGHHTGRPGPLHAVLPPLAPDPATPDC
ncbi:MAG: EAL domain-containing protein [Solirubrobacteraceae bacterium]